MEIQYNSMEPSTIIWEQKKLKVGELYCNKIEL
jgi:hypothetical protein